MSKNKIGIVAGIVFALSVIVSPAFAACTLTDLSTCDNTGLMALIAQLLSGQTATTTPASTTTASYAGIPVGFQFATNLKQGTTSNDVKYLQILLNADSATSIGNAGKETTYFGTMTKAAVVKFQNKYASTVLTPYGLTTGTGFFGTSTRAKANAQLQGTAVVPVTTFPAGCTSATGFSSTTGLPCSTIVTPVTPVTPVTGFNITLAANTPAAASLAKGAVATPVVAYTISSQTAKTLDSVKFTRTGLGLASDYGSVYIYSNGTRLKSSRSISSDSQTVEFTSVGLAIPANGTVDLTVAVDVAAASTTGDVSTMGIAAVADIKFIGGTAITGTFPINGSAMTISSVAIGTATIAAGSVPSSPTIGATAALVGEMKITAGADDITLDKVTFTQNGTISSTLLKNITLKIDGAVLATTAGLTGDTVTMTLTTPYAIGKNKNKTFGIYADINGGKTTDGIRFYIDETSDVVITDVKYNQGANVTNNLTSAHTSRVATLQGGEITITDKGPASNTISRNKTDVELLKFGVSTSRNVTVKDYNLTLTATNKVATTATAATATYVIGTSAALAVTSSATFEVDDYIIVDTDGTGTGTAVDMIAKVTAIPNGTTLTITPVEGTDLTTANTQVVSTVTKITGLRLVNVDTGSVVYSNSTNRYLYSAYLADDQAASDDFDMSIGTAYNFAVRVDISEYSAPDMGLKGGFDLNTASDVKDYDANEYVLAANIVPNTVTGKTMTIGASSLSITRASTPVSGTKVKGTQDVDMLGMSVNAGSSGDVKVSQVVVRFYAGTAGGTTNGTNFVLGTGNIAANQVIDSVSLYDETGKIGTSKSLVSVGWTADTASTYYKATFDNLTYTVAAGASKKLTVKANLKSTLAVDNWIYANVAPADDITAKDSDGNTLTLTNTTSGGINEDDVDVTLISNDVSPVVVIRASIAGSLALKAEGSPSAAIVAAGATNVVMSKYKLSATNEAYILDKLSIASDDGTTDFATAEATNDNDITQVGIRVNGGTPVKANLSSGVANFSNLAVTVPADGYVYIEVLADFNTIAGGATSGETPRLGIYQLQNSNNMFRAVGSGSSTVADFVNTLNTTVTGEENVYAMTVRKTMPTIAKHAGLATTLVNGTNLLYQFDVTADSHEAVALKRVVLSLSANNLALATSSFKLYRGSTDITDKVSIYNPTLGTLETGTDLITGTPTSATVYIVWDGTTEEVIPAGQPNVYSVYAVISGVASGYNIASYIADDTAVIDGNGKVEGITAVGGYAASSGIIYQAAGTNVANADVRTAANVSVLSAYGQTGTGVATFLASDDTDEVRSFGTITTGQTINLTEAGVTSLNIVPITVGTLMTTGGFTCTAYDTANDTGTATVVISAIRSVKCVNATTASQVIVNTTPIAANDGTLQETIITLTTGTYLSGTVVATNDSDIGTPVSVASTAQNFVWSDNSSTSHDVTVSEDWTNGFLVDSLSTSLLSLTAP